MPLTAWNPATQVSRGNVLIGITAAVADINAPTATELGTGVSLDPSITTFSGTSDTDSETVDWLSTTQSETLPGATTHSIDDLLIKVSGQADSDLMTALNVGGVVYVWRRDGLPRGQAVATGDFVWVWKCIVTSVDPAEANNTYVAVNAHITALSRSTTAVAVTA